MKSMCMKERLQSFLNVMLSYTRIWKIALKKTVTFWSPPKKVREIRDSHGDVPLA